METPCLPVALLVWITALAATLDARQQARFVRLCTGLLFARGRRTVTSWLRGCGAGRDYKRYYYLLGSVGRKTPAIARALFRILMKRLPAAGPDTPLVCKRSAEPYPGRGRPLEACHPGDCPPKSMARAGRRVATPSRWRAAILRAGPCTLPPNPGSPRGGPSSPSSAPDHVDVTVGRDPRTLFRC
jgi:hypothetical protein